MGGVLVERECGRAFYGRTRSTASTREKGAVSHVEFGSHEAMKKQGMMFRFLPFLASWLPN
jgi:hypothetical protein